MNCQGDEALNAIAIALKELSDIFTKHNLYNNPKYARIVTLVGHRIRALGGDLAQFGYKKNV